MKISKERLTQFKQIYAQQFGVELDDRTAYDMALKLANLMQLVYKPLLKSDLEFAQKRKELYGKEEDENEAKKE